MSDINGVGGPQGPSGYGDDTGDGGATAIETPDLLAGPEASALAGGDPGAALAVLAMKTAKEQEHVSTDMRHNAERLEDNAEDAQIHSLRDQADLQRAAGIVDGANQIGQAVLGSLGGNGAGKAASVLPGLAKIVSSCLSAEASEKATDAKVHEQQAERAKRAAGDAKQNTDDAKQLLDKALDFYKEYETTKNQTTLAALHRA